MASMGDMAAGWGMLIVIRVEQGRAARAVTSLLSAQLLQILRAYRRLARPGALAVPEPGDGRTGQRRHTAGGSRVAARLAELSKPVTVHTLRHSSATTDIHIIQVLLEAETYCPPTLDRGADLLSVPSPLRRDRAHY
jgi:integrase/recombinase XerD